MIDDDRKIERAQIVHLDAALRCVLNVSRGVRQGKGSLLDGIGPCLPDLIGYRIKGMKIGESLLTMVQLGGTKERSEAIERYKKKLASVRSRLDIFGKTPRSDDHNDLNLSRIEQEMDPDLPHPLCSP